MNIRARILAGLAIVLCMGSSLFAYERNVHTWIAKQAAELYESQYGDHELLAYLGSLDGPTDASEDITRAGCDPEDSKSWYGYSLVEGAYEEDTYGVWMRHFVKGPEGDALTTGLDRRFYRDLWVQVPETLRWQVGYDVSTHGYDGPYWSAYEGAWMEFHRAKAWWKGGGAQTWDAEFRIVSISESDRTRAYYHLGRAAHLLADMTLPVHVRGIPHEGIGGLLVGEIAPKDRYEVQVNADGTHPFTNYGIGLSRGPQWSRVRDYATLEDLFRQSVRYTAEYPPVRNFPDGLPRHLVTSNPITIDSPDVDDDTRHRSADVQSLLYTTIWNDSFIKPEDIDTYMGILAADLMPFAIEQTASLIALFYESIGIGSGQIFTLSVQSNSAVLVQCSPSDSEGKGTGTADFTRKYTSNVSVTLTAPQTDSSGHVFSHWEYDTSTFSSRSLSVTMDSNKSLRADYGSGGDPTSQLLVCGSATPGTYEITVAPGNGKWRDVPVQNAGYSSVEVNCTKSGTAASWTRLSSDSFTLGPQESINHRITINVPSDASSGTYAVTVAYNSVQFQISIRVAGLGEPWDTSLQSSSVWIDGSSSSKQYSFDNVSYPSFDISGKYQTHAQTYCTLSKSEYLNAGDFVLSVSVWNLDAEDVHDLNIKVNGTIVYTKSAESVSKGSGLAFTTPSISWETLKEGVNVISFGLRQYNTSDETYRWRIYDNVKMTTDATTSAWGAEASVSVPYNIWNAIDDGYLASARIYADVIQVSRPGRVYLYNNGEQTNSSANIDSNGNVYWRLSKTELEEDDNYFVLKGDTSSDPRVQLSNIKFVITLRDADPVLEITKELDHQEIQVGEQVTVTLTATNTREDSATGYDTILSDSLPSGLTTVSGDLTKNIGNLRYEDVKTHTYTILADQAGRYVLPAAKVDYENIHGDPLVDQSSPVELTVMAGSLQVEATVAPPAVSIGGTVEFSATVTSSATGQPVADAAVQGIVQRENGSGWETIATVPLGWSPEQNQFIGQSAEVVSSGEYQAYVIAQKDLYQDGASQAVPFSITIVTCVLTAEVAGGGGTISGGGPYRQGEVALVAAVPNTGYRVKSWTGTDDDTSTSTTNTVTMTGNKTVTVTFESSEPTYTLVVNHGSGDGEYAAGSVQTITADVPPAGRAFNGWTGDTQYVADANNASTTVTMPEANVTVTATYRDEVGETIFGWNYLYCDLAGSACFPYGSTVQTGSELSQEFVVESVGSTILTGDVDGDGALEIVTASGSSLYLYSGTGSLERTISLPRDSFVTMLADADGDGVLDIGLGGNGVDFSGYVYRGDGTLLKTFAGQHASNDSSDKSMRLLGVSDGKVLVGYNAGYGLTPRGIASFDYTTEAEAWYYQVGPPNGYYSVADMDGDGVLDLTMNSATVHNGVSGNGTTDGDLYLVVVDEEGNGKISQKYQSPSDGGAKHVFADMDGDGIEEIVGFEEHDPTYYSGRSQIHLYDTSGSTLHSFDGPDNTGWTYAIGDLEGNGSQEIVATAVRSNTTYVLDSTLQKVQEANVAGSVRLIADLTGDGNKEIVLLTSEAVLRILDSNLAELGSIQAGAGNGIVIASDIDADGKVELLCRTDRLYVFALEGDPVDAQTFLIGGTVYSDLGNPLTSGVEDVTLTITGSAGSYEAVTAGASGLWEIADVNEGTYTVTPEGSGYEFQHVENGSPDSQSSIVIEVNQANKAANQSIQFLAAAPQILHDWNGDGIVSIVGDVPGFVNCVYFNNCPDGVDTIAVGDCNGDGILSIVGDVPCFVDCVYFGNCTD